MDQRRAQLRRAQQRQRLRDRAAGLVLYQAKLPVEQARRLKAGLKNPEFRKRFAQFLDSELIDTTELPILKAHCASLGTTFVTRSEAHAVYSEHLEDIDQTRLSVHEKVMMNRLLETFE